MAIKSSKKEELKSELLALMRVLRSRIDPEILESARRKLHGQMAAEFTGEDKGRDTDENTVPYDRECAHEAVRLFLQHHPSPENFSRKLAMHLQKDISNSPEPTGNA